MNLLGDDLPTIRWFVAEPSRLETELEAMLAIAPSLTWWPKRGAGGEWRGELPLWPFDRAEPADLRKFVARGLRVRIECSAAHPMVAPRVFPTRPTPGIGYRTLHAWHVNGDGSLCMLQSAAAWDGSELAAELAVKAAGWLLEYKLMNTGAITAMTLGGVCSSDALDPVIRDAISKAQAS